MKGWGARNPCPFGWGGGGGLNPCPFASREGLGGGLNPCPFASLVHLQVVKGWGGGVSLSICASRESKIHEGLGLLNIRRDKLGDSSLATPQGCGRRPEPLSSGLHGLAGARRRPPTHRRRGVVGGFGVWGLGFIEIVKGLGANKF